MLQHVCVGLNWGAIEPSGFLSSLLGTPTAVDLDGAVTTFEGNEIVETVYFKRLWTRDGAIRHSGDDLTGDMNGDDGLDNEVITIDLTLIDPYVDTIYIYLNSYKGQDFGKIPYSKLRIYEGTPTEVENVLATFNLSVEEQFKGYVSMVMGRLVRNGSGWDFETLGEPLKPRNIPSIARHLQEKYLL